MDYSLQTSAKAATKVLHGARAIIDGYNAINNPNNENKIKFEHILADFSSDNSTGQQKQKRISKAIWANGIAPNITNTPYYAGISEIILENRVIEMTYFNSVNNCLKNALLANIGNTFDTEQMAIGSQISDALLQLDELTVSSQMREKLFDQFYDEFTGIASDKPELKQIFQQGLDHYNSLALKETLSKFLVDIEPNTNQPAPDNGHLDSPSI